jgi:hypothetical protein
MSNFASGTYKVQNVGKYIGKGSPRYRSSWELTFMRFCDSNKNVLQWASESIAIKYRHPFTGKMTNYIPDFLITYRNKNNVVQAELIEIKPKVQSLVEGKMNEKARMIVAINHAKWASATVWARNNGISFRVVTEHELFSNGAR